MLPGGHLVSMSHAEQADAPELAWYVPSWQGMHWSLALRANVPGVHSRGVTEPMIQACPAGQGVHPSAEVRPVALLDVPLGHSAAAALPLGQKPPALHGSGWLVAPGHMEPAGQSSVHHGPFCAVSIADEPDIPGAQANGKSAATLPLMALWFVPAASRNRPSGAGRW